MLEMFSIKDDLAGFFMKPFVCRSVVEAQRQIVAFVRQEKSIMAEYPSNFSLYRVGSFDDVSGQIPTNLKMPEHLGTVSAILGMATPEGKV